MWHYLVLFLANAFLVTNVHTDECPPGNTEIHDALFQGIAFGPPPGLVPRFLTSSHVEKVTYHFLWNYHLLNITSAWLSFNRVKFAKLTIFGFGPLGHVLFQESHRINETDSGFLIWDIGILAEGPVMVKLLLRPNVTMTIKSFEIVTCLLPGWCAWSPWSNSDCSVTCGGGVQYSKRECHCPNPKPGKFKCPTGPKIRSRQCNTACCPNNVNWESRTNTHITIRNTFNNKARKLHGRALLVLKGSGMFVTLLKKRNSTHYLQVALKVAEQLLTIKMKTKLANMITVETSPAKLPPDQAVRGIPITDISENKWNRRNFNFGPEGVGPVKKVRLDFGYTTDKIHVKDMEIIVCSRM